MKLIKSRRNCIPLLFYYLKRIGPCLLIVCLAISFLLYHYQTEDVTDALKLLVKGPAITILESDIEPEPNTDRRSSANQNDSSMACQIPQLEPYSSEVKAYLRTLDNKSMIVKNGCTYYKFFNSTMDGRIVPVLSKEIMLKFHEIRSCCYKNFSRGSGDYLINISKSCHPLSLTEATKILPEHEFIIISCEKERNGSRWNKTIDVHLFTPIKPEVEERLNRNVLERERKPNVVILSLDAVSRMNFMRSMPKSHSYLMREMNALEMRGFHKIGDSSVQNMFPLLLSQSDQEVYSGCGKDRFYDDCPIIWKFFRDKNYITSYAEDRNDISIFNYAYGPCCDGFITQPTDYYLRPFSVEAAARLHNNYNLCYGPRKSFEVLLDNVQKFMFHMKRNGKPFFQFTHSTGLTHDHNIRMAEYGDPHLFQLLKWMKESEIMNDTLFILMSDHGWNRGKFFNTIQGRVESRLTLLYLVLPDWMKRDEYSRAYENLLVNRERLVTTYDLHQLLLDILNPEVMQNGNIDKRQRQLSDTPDALIPRGISPLLRIPKKRTCEMAAIDPNACVCKFLRQLARNSTAASKAALMAVDKINSLLSSSFNCSFLSLSFVSMAQHGIQQEKDREWEGIRVNFQTKPGNATFEALVATTRSKLSDFFKRTSHDWKVVGMISRTNLYGNQSYCVNDRFLKPYCYCV